jgi:hypothetical protein
MSFFKAFKKIPYKFDNDQPSSNITDLFHYVVLDELFTDKSTAYQYYEVGDGERPDIVSQKLYGTPDYYWTIFLINEHLSDGHEAWPLSSQEYERYIKHMYDGIVIHANYEIIYNTDGQLIDHKNSVAGRFEIGEPVIGSKSGATGYILDKDPTLNHIYIGGIKNGIANPDIQTLGGPFRLDDLIIGDQTSDSISTNKIWPWAKAPKYYLDENGIETTTLDIIHSVNNGTKYVSFEEYEKTLNEDRRHIRVIRPSIIDDFVIQYKKKMRGEI